MIFTPAKVNLGSLSGPATIGVDLGLGFPNTSGGKFTATAQWAVTVAPDLFKFGRFDLLSLSAKAGVGFTQQGSSSFFTANSSLALSMSYTLIPGDKGMPALLSVFLQDGFSSVLDHRDSQFHITTTLPGVLGVKGNF